MLCRSLVAGGLILAVSWCAAAQDTEVPVPEVPIPEEGVGRKLIIPFAFWNDSFDLALGVAAGALGWPQPQAGMVGAVAVGTNGSWSLFAAGEDLRIPGLDRLFFRPMVAYSDVAEFQAFTDGNLRYFYERAGSNDSSEDNYLEGDGIDIYTRLRLKYVLPMGHGRETPDKNFELDRGILVGGAIGGEHWSPLRSGHTSIELEPVYRRQVLLCLPLY